MKKVLLLGIILFLSENIFGQNIKGFVSFDEYSLNQPSLNIECQFKQRTNGDIFMMGGIANYRVVKIKPKTNKELVEKHIWGIMIDSVVYINSFPYSKILGYNKIEGKGHYSYFIGEPARTETEQRNLGIIKPNERKIAVCCKVGYVIFLNGTIKMLKPELLLELCEDNENLIEKIKKADLKIENVPEMFQFLNLYNKWIEQLPPMIISK